MFVQSQLSRCQYGQYRIWSLSLFFWQTRLFLSIILPDCRFETFNRKNGIRISVRVQGVGCDTQELNSGKSAILPKIEPVLCFFHFESFETSTQKTVNPVRFISLQKPFASISQSITVTWPSIKLSSHITYRMIEDNCRKTSYTKMPSRKTFLCVSFVNKTTREKRKEEEKKKA